jgi:hypothetical protein
MNGKPAFKNHRILGFGEKAKSITWLFGVEETGIAAMQNQ